MRSDKQSKTLWSHYSFYSLSSSCGMFLHKSPACECLRHSLGAYCYSFGGECCQASPLAVNCSKSRLTRHLRTGKLRLLNAKISTGGEKAHVVFPIWLATPGLENTRNRQTWNSEMSLNCDSIFSHLICGDAHLADLKGSSWAWDWLRISSQLSLMHMFATPFPHPQVLGCLSI